MSKPFDFANDSKLGGIGDLMQRAANRRKAQGVLFMRGRIRTAMAECLCLVALYGAAWGVLVIGHGLGY